MLLRGDRLRGQLMSPLSVMIKQSCESPVCSDSAETSRSPPASRLAPATAGFAPGSASRAAVHCSPLLSTSVNASMILDRQWSVLTSSFCHRLSLYFHCLSFGFSLPFLNLVFSPPSRVCFTASFVIPLPFFNTGRALVTSCYSMRSARYIPPDAKRTASFLIGG